VDHVTPYARGDAHRREIARLGTGGAGWSGRRARPAAATTVPATARGERGEEAENAERQAQVPDVMVVVQVDPRAGPVSAY
jgi:hypothetical protein